jgi:hypothetical protein
MKPDKLTLKQLEAIPLKKYDSEGWSKSVECGHICTDLGITLNDCRYIACDLCCVDSPESVRARIAKLKQKQL